MKLITFLMAITCLVLVVIATAEVEGSEPSLSVAPPALGEPSASQVAGAVGSIEWIGNAEAILMKDSLLARDNAMLEASLYPSKDVKSHIQAFMEKDRIEAGFQNSG